MFTRGKSKQKRRCKSGDGRDIRDAKDGKDEEDARRATEAKDGRDIRDINDGTDVEDERCATGSEANNGGDVSDIRDGTAVKDAKDGKGASAREMYLMPKLLRASDFRVCSVLGPRFPCMGNIRGWAALQENKGEGEGGRVVKGARCM
jgi:hypothetical protein